MKYIILAISSLTFFVACKKSESISFQFKPIEIQTKASIRGLHVIDENNIWLSGSEGSVFRTEDGGKNWIDCTIDSESDNDFRSIHAFDSKHAFVLGINNPAIIYSTNDGGSSWQRADSLSAPGLFFNSLKFSNKMDGMAVSDPVDDQFFVIQSQDKGKSWQRCSTLPNALDGESNFAASNTCIEYIEPSHAWIACGGSTVRVFYTKDNGQHWQVANTPFKSNQKADGIYSICFKNHNNGLIVGGNYQFPEQNDRIACYTNDGGTTWQLAQTMPSGFRSCVQYFSNNNDTIAVAIGKTGFDYSTDNGINWKTGGTKGYYTIRPIPGQFKGYVAGSDGRVTLVTIIIE